MVSTRLGRKDPKKIMMIFCLRLLMERRLKAASTLVKPFVTSLIISVKLSRG